MLVLALESSTSSAKGMLYDSERGIVGVEQMKYDAADCAIGSMDTEGAFRATMKIGRKLAAGREIAAIALGGIWHSIAVCDAALNPVTPTYTWEFAGAAQICADIRCDEAFSQELYRRTGCMPHYCYPRHTLQYLKEQGLDLSDKLFVTQGAYHFYRMTGQFCETVSTQCGTGVVNIHTLDYDEDTLGYLGLRREQFGRLVNYRDVSALSEQAAGMLGLKPGIPVVPAHPDGALNQIGNYANFAGQMTLSVGTSAALRTVADRPTFGSRNQLWCYYGVNSWVSGAAISGACNCLNWFSNTCLGGTHTLAELDAMADGVRETPVFLPFLFGERCPGWQNGARAGFYDLRPEHTLGSLYRAIEMGVLFNLRQCYDAVLGENGEPENIIVSGGITNSAQWTQMLADILGRELRVVSNPDASCAGAVALALHTVGCLEDINGFKADFELSRTVEPNEKMFDYYRQQYDRYLAEYAKMGEEFTVCAVK
ncbi:gluconokinase [Feifania hominis]|uniref:Xylulose kinase n=1 Tax=Feifania hominis TaxID=2763660 RepID=A0A926DEW3_9FIRM|nr:FGGY-family carbohydrate kinase [Feifania hominis]MBC8536039.1 hypothetical protein [Feifania hominis]